MTVFLNSVNFHSPKQLALRRRNIVLLLLLFLKSN